MIDVSLIYTIHYINWRKHKVYCGYFSRYSNVSNGFANNIKDEGKKLVTCPRVHSGNSFVEVLVLLT